MAHKVRVHIFLYVMVENCVVAYYLCTSMESAINDFDPMFSIVVPTIRIYNARATQTHQTC